MKLKRTPEDFQVEEQVTLQPAAGPFAFYRLTKKSLGTREVIDAILQRWKLPRKNIAYAGLKDKHALTTQYLTIHNGPRRGLSQTNLELEYLGQVPQPVHARHITANHFLIVIRDLTNDEPSVMTEALAAVSRDGLPNYFDDQRFGSLGKSGEFIAKPWCLGNYERALWLALADENVHDRPLDRQEKQILRQRWGDWPKCKQLLSDPQNQRIAAYLADRPDDFRGAIALMRQDLRSLWIAALQSHLWNQILAALIQQVCPPEQCITQLIGQRELPVFIHLNSPQRQQLQAMLLPLPSARLHLDPGPLRAVYDQVLSAERMELRQVRVKYPRDSFFSKGDRRAVVQPGRLTHEVADDELYPGRRKLNLSFTLPRGSYATMLVKRVTGIASDETIVDEGNDDE